MDNPSRVLTLNSVEALVRAKTNRVEPELALALQATSGTLAMPLAGWIGSAAAQRWGSWGAESSPELDWLAVDLGLVEPQVSVHPRLARVPNFYLPEE